MSVEYTIRNGSNYMSSGQRAMYCKFQAGDSLEDTARSLVAGVRPGLGQINYVHSIGTFVKNNITYKETGAYPQEAEYTLETAESGNCVDQSVLLMSLFEALDIEARYCCYHEEGEEVGHCLVEVRLSTADRHPGRVERRLVQKAGLTGQLAWDIDSGRAWLLVDPTSPLPVGFERGPAFTVGDEGVQWHRDTNVVCFAPA